MSEVDLVVNTSLGPIRGQKCQGIYGHNFYSFEKIPFAECPINELRFRPPQAKKPWTDILDCTQKAIKPPQRTYATNLYEGDEDCLYINIYAKELKTGKPLPVIIFIYGGGFENGDPTKDLHGPDYLMMKDLVFATMGYRLGPLGFIAFKDPQLQIPGNAGLKDQLMALQWLKKNIAHFNGDPENITLAGESAGSSSVHYLMSCPLAENLFHKAILMSGNILCPFAFSQLENIPYRLATACGYNGSPTNEMEILEFLQKQSAEILTKPYLPTKEEILNDCHFTSGPTIETYPNDMCIIDKHPDDLVKQSWANNIPVLMSGTSFEGLLMFGRAHMAPFLVTELEENPQHCLPLKLKEKFSPEWQRKMGNIVKCSHFGEEKADLNNVLKYCEYASYKVFWHPIYRALKARIPSPTTTPHVAPTYLYRFDFDSPDFNHQRIKYCGKQMRGVAHVDDHSYLFYGNFSWKLSPETDEYKTIERMISIWYNFALNSNPNSEEITKELNEPWLPVAAEGIIEADADGGASGGRGAGGGGGTGGNHLKCLNIGKQLAVIDLPEMEKLRVWENIHKIEN